MDDDSAPRSPLPPALRHHPLDGLLMDGVPLNAIADAVGTPTYVYSAATIRRRAAALAEALGPDIAIHYAVKANDRLAVLGVIAALGLGADVVSGGELLRALRAGIPASCIVFSGTGKTDEELRLALDHRIGQINVESAAEIDRLGALGAGGAVPIALRVNPDVDAGTHAKISTGRAADKFGIGHEHILPLYARAAAHGLRPIGLAVHIGSQVMDAAPFRAAYARLADLVRALRAAGQTVETVDCGGGIGVAPAGAIAPTPVALAGAIRATLGGLGLHLAVEPGRFLVAPAGLLLSSVILQKQQDGRRIVVIDAGMNDLPRPAIYGARHAIVPVSAVVAAQPASPATVVGPVCESADSFFEHELPDLEAGARVAILDAGAYGAVMASTYNARPMPAEVLVDGDWSVIRRRQSWADLWRDEVSPA